jgi:hypothetical protein
MMLAQLVMAGSCMVAAAIAWALKPSRPRQAAGQLPGLAADPER